MAVLLGVRFGLGGGRRRAPRTSAEIARRAAVGIRLHRGDHLRGGFMLSIASAHFGELIGSEVVLSFASSCGGFMCSRAAASLRNVIMIGSHCSCRFQGPIWSMARS